ncbi:hypothetical protein BLL42_23605 [Pseudomonas frederiksbergensis]|uniref:Uncharacterized protein n=1 Tax=Pseudomonas frederiksbergensis TaxID=104087 RepID=A0A1J0ERB7_9PSED|nr:hypothetical protein [Pseudomonas frederiksbergensis]APC18550.1 hypothetical protein BLL42_23605 [Pseudomonas frederiksbergensis]
MAAKNTPKEKDAASASTDDQGLVKDSLQDDATSSAASAASESDTGSTLNQDGSALTSLLAQGLVPNAALPAAPLDSLEQVTQDEKLPRYYVTDVSSVLHDGQWYHMGDDISLSDTEAGPLLQRRIIEPIQEFNQ